MPSSRRPESGFFALNELSEVERDAPPSDPPKRERSTLRLGFGYRAGTMRIGSLELKSNLFLSPLAGYTNLPFRLTLREVGGLDLATTDLVNARSLLEENHKAFKLVETCPADSPLGVPLFGSVAGALPVADSFAGY